jgi:hypothetical protein
MAGHILHDALAKSKTQSAAILDWFSINKQRARAGHLGVVVVNPDPIEGTGKIEALPIKVDEVSPSVRKSERELGAQVVGDTRMDGSKIR